ncbi:tetratricopeptide repeat protein [Pedobacter xixiisoli]|uniref:histidine kinase n=1 Tax=Pedobacter xixiisoli TaxID=1476464 RepID=A0A285ZRZ1_9SPHI|nr:tetratricopeptide repeat protein [Pedobacter xixiisoli]SOD12405.1 Tetratricopeptide repeat-containing protein [Pedobacter xixiisoli]
MKLSFSIVLILLCLSGYAQKNNAINSAQKEVDNLLAAAQKSITTDIPKTKQLLKRALQISGRYHLENSMGKIHSLSGELAGRASNYTESLAYILKALEFYKKTDDTAGTAHMYNNLGNIYDSTGQMKKSEDSYLAAIRIYETLKDKAGAAKAMMNISITFFKQQKYQPALAYAFKSLKIREGLKNDEDLAYSYATIGTMYLYTDKFVESIEYNKKSLRISDRRNNAYAMAIDRINIAKALTGLGNYNGAKNYLSQVLPIAGKYGDKRALRHAYEDLSAIAQKENKVEQAIAWLNRAIDVYKGTDDAYTELSQLVNRHSLYVLQKKYKQAENDLLAAENIVKKQNMVGEMEGIKRMQVNLYIKMGKADEGSAVFEQFEKYKDSALSATSLKQINELKTKYETEEKENQLNKSKLLLAKKENEARTRNLWLFGIAGIALSTLAASLYSYRQQQQKHTLKTAILKIDGENRLNEQRLDISRNLHDNIGSQLTFINSFMETLKLMSDAKNEAINDRINNISTFTKDAIVELRDTVWALNSDEFTFEDLRLRILDYIDKAQTAKENIQFKFEADEQLESIRFSSVQGINLYRTIQEAVNNAIKYAEATQISINTKVEDAGLAISIIDDGSGFNPQNNIGGNGLYNMRKRIEDIGGEFVLKSKVGEGTQIHITLKGNLNA